MDGKSDLESSMRIEKKESTFVLSKLKRTLFSRLFLHFFSLPYQISNDEYSKNYLHKLNTFCLICM